MGHGSVPWFLFVFGIGLWCKLFLKQGGFHVIQHSTGLDEEKLQKYSAKKVLGEDYFQQFGEYCSDCFCSVCNLELPQCEYILSKLCVHVY